MTLTQIRQFASHLGLYTLINAPGDGCRRYRFTPSSHATYSTAYSHSPTLLGPREAYAYLLGYQNARLTH